MKKKLFSGFVLAVLVLFLLVGCSSTTNSSPTDDSNQASGQPLTQEEMNQLFQSPDRFKDRPVTVYGKVFNIMEGQFQIYADPEGLNNNVIVQGDTSQIKQDEIVKVSGVVVGNQEFENMMGGKVSAALVKASAVEKSDYVTAFHPAIRVIELGQEQNQAGHQVKVEKVEIAEKQTRVYLSLKNDAKNKFYFYTHSMKLIQNGKQFEEAMDFSAPEEFPQVQSEILPGSSTEGVVVFPAIQADQPFKIHMEGSSDNYSLELKPYVVEVAK